MRIRATRRVQTGPVTVELECDIECTEGEFVDHEIADTVKQAINDTLFREAEAGDAFTPQAAMEK